MGVQTFAHTFAFLKKRTFCPTQTKIKVLCEFIRLLPINFLEGQIRPEDLLVGHVHVQGNYAFLTGDDLRVLTLIQSHLPHLVAVSEE